MAPVPLLGKGVAGVHRHPLFRYRRVLVGGYTGDSPILKGYGVFHRFRSCLKIPTKAEAGGKGFAGAACGAGIAAIELPPSKEWSPQRTTLEMSPACTGTDLSL